VERFDVIQELVNELRVERIIDALAASAQPHQPPSFFLGLFPAVGRR